MPHSYANNLVHLVFSTHERRPMIPPESIAELWAVMAGIGRNHRLTVIKIGGMADHAHVLFSWPEGYGAFTVSASAAGTVKEYIGDQAEHHKKRSFEDELLALLKKSGGAYDPKFVFG